MSPQLSQGCNLALIDAEKLADAIVTWRSSREFESPRGLYARAVVAHSVLWRPVTDLRRLRKPLATATCFP